MAQARGSRGTKGERELTPVLLRRWPLPWPDHEGDKEQRGRVLVVGGSPSMPGAVILAATAALRAGAGKLQIATPKSIAHLVAAQVLEAKVFALPETRGGGLAPGAVRIVAEQANRAQAVLIGPGVVDERAVARFMTRLAHALRPNGPVLVVDAEPLAWVGAHPRALAHLRGRLILTPHAGEMATMLGRSRASIERDAAEVARFAAERMSAVVALKGAVTHVASREGAFCNRAGNVGLATSGSGDTLSGIVTGLAARGGDPTQATVFGVHVHARAGDVLARRVGPLGYLARELLAEVPQLLARLDPKRR